MAHEARTIDPELMNLNGGLFESAKGPARAVVHSDLDMAMSVGIVDWKDVSGERQAMLPNAPVRRGFFKDAAARRLGQMVGGAAVVVLGIGLAAASVPWRSLMQTQAPAAAAGVEEPEPVRPVMMGDGVPWAGEASSTTIDSAAEPVETTTTTTESVLSPVAWNGAPKPAATLAPSPVQTSSLTALATPSRPFSGASAAVAVANAGRGATGCLPPGDARANMPVRVVFAPSGRVTSAAVQGGPFLGNAVGSCIARTLRSARVNPFDGEPAAVTTTLHLR